VRQSRAKLEKDLEPGTWNVKLELGKKGVIVRCRIGFSLFLLLAIALFPVPVFAGQWYLGGTLERVSFGSELADIDFDADFGLVGGYRYSPYLALDFVLSGGEHFDRLVGSYVTCSSLDMGVKFIFNDVLPLQPFFIAGLSSHYLDYGFSTLDIEGTGLFAGVGLEGFLDSANSVGLSVKTHWWTGEDLFFSYNARTTSVGIFFTHYLRGP